MKYRNKGRSIKIYISTAVLVCLTIGLAFAAVSAYTIESTRYPSNIAEAQAAATAASEGKTASNNPVVTSNPDIVPAKWTFMVYVSADDGTLEQTAINDFIEMATVGSTEDINILVQLDRIPGYDDSYDGWTDCRRFLITQGLTPADGSELMNIGEVNMGDPATLAGFVEWAAFNYPAEKYALVISSHGKGWEGLCWDETSGNDNMNLLEMRSAFSEISELIGQPVDLLGFDACLMGMTEVSYELREYASIMVASEHAEPSSGWPYDTILARLVENPEAETVHLASFIVDNYYAAYAPTGYTMAAVDLTKIDAVVVSLGNLAQALVVYAGADTEAIKEYASSVITALDEAVICESHGARWPGSHGLAIYFPKTRDEFNQVYSAAEVTLANDTAWDEFIHGYFTYAGDDWITAARAETQQYYAKEHVDLYDFCQNLIGE